MLPLKISLNDIPLIDVVNRYIQAFPAPVSGLMIDVDRTPDDLGIYNIWTYKEQTNDLPQRKMEDLALWLTDMKDFINSSIITGAVQLSERDYVKG